MVENCEICKIKDLQKFSIIRYIILCGTALLRYLQVTQVCDRFLKKFLQIYSQLEVFSKDIPHAILQYNYGQNVLFKSF